MKFWRAFRIFLYLLDAKEWYVIAELRSTNKHFKDADISLGKLSYYASRDIDDCISQEILLEEAKQIILTK